MQTVGKHWKAWLEYSVLLSFSQLNQTSGMRIKLLAEKCSRVLTPSWCLVQRVKLSTTTYSNISKNRGMNQQRYHLSLPKLILLASWILEGYSLQCSTSGPLRSGYYNPQTSGSPFRRFPVHGWCLWTWLMWFNSSKTTSSMVLDPLTVTGNN